MKSNIKKSILRAITAFAAAFMLFAAVPSIYDSGRNPVYLDMTPDILNDSYHAGYDHNYESMS